MKFFGIVLLCITALFPAYQLYSLPNISDQTALFSQYLGMMALILMAWGQILATRLPGIEFVFGGLDRVYVLHKWVGTIAMAAVLFHDTIDAEMRGLGRETALNDVAETLGEISLYGLLVLVVISVATFIPYHLWKWTHKAMGALFAAASFHFFFIMKPFSMSDPTGIYTGVFCIAGLAAYAWTLLPQHMRPSRAYRITNVEPTGGALAITLAPLSRALRPVPGQFGVLRFTDSGNSEPHPFSFSQIEADGVLRVTVKALGDFTSRLGGTLEIGQKVHIQGPFGRFRLYGKGRKVWIAGGIGITPFLAGAKALAVDADPVDLFYCVSSKRVAPHLAELQKIAAAKPNLNLHLFASSLGSRLSGDHIAEVVGGDLSSAKISFCGPVTLRVALQTALNRHGVTSRRFHYEEFEFRTGIGLQKLATLILSRAQNNPLSGNSRQI